MKNRMLISVPALLLVLAMVSLAQAASLRFDSVPREVNIYVGMPGNGYLAEGGEVWQNSLVIDMRAEGTGMPQWQNPKRISGPELELIRRGGEDSPSFCWELGAIPDSPGDSVYEVQCTMDGQVLTETVTIHCVEVEWPSGLSLKGMEDTVHSYVGARLLFEPEILPEGWEIPGFPQLRWGFDDEADAFAEVVSVKKDISRDPRADIQDRNRLVLRRSGVYQSTYVITSDTVSVGRLVTFEIDENPDWSFVVPEDTRVIEAGSLEGDVRAVYIPEGCEAIRAGAFADAGVDVIFIPSSVTDIAEDALMDVTVYTPRGSYASEWASRRGYPVVLKEK